MSLKWSPLTKTWKNGTKGNSRNSETIRSVESNFNQVDDLKLGERSRRKMKIYGSRKESTGKTVLWGKSHERESSLNESWISGY